MLSSVDLWQFLHLSPIWIFCMFYRYLRLVVNEYAYLCLRAIKPIQEPTLFSKDVTVIIPCLAGDGIEKTLTSILKTNPFEVFLVTIDAHLEKAQRMVASMQTNRVRIFSISQPNKRRQMVKALPHVRTAITIFADDDVIWPATLFKWILAPFEDKQYGGVGTNQRLQRAEKNSVTEWFFEFVGDVYLQRRNFDCGACNYMDGGLPCLSGRTVAYRTSIVQDQEFVSGFSNELWCLGGKYHLNADDDNFITRWLVNRGWKIAFQHHPEAEVLTVLEKDSKYLKQCLRWARSNWRSNTTSMLFERVVWSRHPWSSYAVFMTTYTHLAIAWDFGLWYFRPDGWATFWVLLTLMVVSKFIKLIPLLVRNPDYVLLIPFSVMFGYFHGAIKIWAGLTMHETAWGSREGADTDDASRMVPVMSAAPCSLSSSCEKIDTTGLKRNLSHRQLLAEAKKVEEAELLARHLFTGPSLAQSPFETSLMPQVLVH